MSEEYFVYFWLNEESVTSLFVNGGSLVVILFKKNRERERLVEALACRAEFE